MTKNFFYFLLPSLVTGALGMLIMTPISTFYLDPKDFGIAAILSAITAPITLAAAGSSWVLSAHYFKIEPGQRRILLFNLLFVDFVFKFIVVVSFWVLSPWVLPVLIKDYEPQYAFYFQLLLLSILLQTFWVTISFLLVIEKRARLHAFFEIGGWIVGSLTVVISLAVMHVRTSALFWGPVGSSFFFFIAILFYAWSRIEVVFDKKWMGEIMKLGFPAIPSNAMGTLTTMTENYFIQRWIGLADLGIYAYSTGYRSVFMMGLKAFNRVIAPAFLEGYSHNADTTLLRIGLRKIYGLLGIAGMFVIFFSYEIIDLFTHGKFAAAAPLVPIWFFLILSLAFGIPYIQFILAKKKNYFLSVSSITIGAVFLGITAVLIFIFGIIGAAVSAVLTNATMQFVNRLYVRKFAHIPVAEQSFSVVVVFLLSLYFTQQWFALNLFVRCILFVLLGIAIVYYYDLWKDIRKRYDQLFFPHNH